MERLSIGSAGSGTRLGLRLVVAGMLVLGLSIGPATAAVEAFGADLHGSRGPNGARVVPVKSTESGDWRRSESRVLPWKLGVPKLTFEGFEQIITAASGGLANTSLAAKEYGFADYMFVIDGTGVGVYWEEASGERQTAGILNEVFDMFQTICEGKSASAQTRKEANDTFALRQGFVACQNRNWDTYIAVSALNFGMVTQIFATIGRAENRDVLDLINRNITNVEIKVFSTR
jgi:hypothetical protein